MCCRFIRLHYTPPLPTDESAEAEADMAKMMFLIVKRQWQQHQQQLTALFAVCGHKQNYLYDQVSLNLSFPGGGFPGEGLFPTLFCPPPPPDLLSLAVKSAANEMLVMVACCCLMKSIQSACMCASVLHSRVAHFYMQCSVKIACGNHA